MRLDSQGLARGAFEATIKLEAAGVKVIVGPAFSSEGVVVSLLANVFDFVCISYSATSPRLSDKRTHPNFFRDVPSDAGQGVALANFVKEIGQKKVVVCHTDDSYGLGLLNVFRARAEELNITVALTVTLPDLAGIDAVETLLRPAVDVVYSKASAGEARQRLDVGTFLYFGPGSEQLLYLLKAGEKLELAGNPFVWITSDGGAGLDLVGPKTLELLKPETLVGLLGTGPAAPTSELYKKNMFAEYERRRLANYTINVFGKDTVLREQPHIFSSYSYDAFMVAARALDSLYERGLFNFTIAELKATVNATDFIGVTGRVKFDEFQDRDALYDVVNAADGKKWIKVGSYDQGKLKLDKLTFSGGKNEPPKFELPPPPFNPGYIALIVVCLAVALLAAALVAAYFLRKAAKARKLAAQDALNAEPLYWTSAEEIEEIAPLETKFDMDAKQVVATTSAEERAQYEVVRDSAVPLFGVARGTRCNVNEELLDTITLINHTNKPVDYAITVPTSGEEYAFDLVAKPGVGTLKPKETRQINLTFKLLFTTKVNRWVKVVFAPAEGKTDGTYVAVRLEGVVSARIDPMELELYGKPIGEGAFGIVYRGKYRGTLVAAKVPRKQGEMREAQLKSFKDEIALFEKLRSPYIVNFIGASHVPGRLCICTELLERGTVFELIHKAKVSNVLKVKILIDAANSLAYLHKNGVLYRDMKPDNLLVTSVSHTAAVNVRLSDFGTAISTNDVNVPSVHTGSIGTPAYMAPEIMANQPYNCKVDVYSLGMLSWEVFAEAVPFSFLKRVWDLPRLVLDGMRPELPSDWPKGVRDVISDCWLQAPEKRPSAENVATALERVFEPLKKDYEKSRKSKAQAVVEDDDGKQVPSKSRTAGTGQLDRIIEMGAHQVDEPTGEGKVRRAADLRSTNDPDSEAPPSEVEPEETKPKKKKKKAAAAAAAAADEPKADE
jgi:serine/threonine protein kinase